jgi:hypothetical protein
MKQSPTNELFELEPRAIDRVGRLEKDHPHFRIG